MIAEVHNTYGERHAYLLPPGRPAGDDGQEVLRLAVQSGGRLLPGAGAATGQRSRRHRVAAPRAAGPHSPSSPPTCAASGDRRPSGKSRSCKSFRRWRRWWWPLASGYRGSNCGYVECRWCRDDRRSRLEVETYSAAIDSERWPAVAKVPYGPGLARRRRRSPTGCCAARRRACRCDWSTPTARWSARPIRPFRRW